MHAGSQGSAPVPGLRRGRNKWGSGAHRRRGQPQAAGGDMDRHDQHAPAATEWTLSEPRSHGNAIHIKKTHESSN